MTPGPFARAELLLGPEALERLGRCRVAIFGIGGVGSFTVEALARTGVGRLALVDPDRVQPSNLNRQLLALHSTLGRLKVDVMAERVRDINPVAEVEVYPLFYLPENAGTFELARFDYIVDAVDTVSAKVELAVRAQAARVPLISCMGAGNKLDPARFEVADLGDTAVCPLCKVMRRELRRRGVERLKVVYSREPPLRPEAPAAGSGEGDGQEEPGARAGRRNPPGSVAFVPSTAGLLLAAEVVRDLLGAPRAAGL